MLNYSTIFQTMSDVAPTEFSLCQALSGMAGQHNPNVSLKQPNPFNRLAWR